MTRQIQTLLVPVDGSDCSRAALEFACDLAAKFGAKINVLMVLDSPAKIASAPDEQASAGALKELRQFVKSARTSDTSVTERVAFGNAVERIIEGGEQQHADLIVLGTHGRTGRARSLAGSVAESVVRMASCPVVTVRG